MSIIVKKNGVDISSSIERQSFVLNWALTNEVGRAEFRIKNYGTNVSCDLGDEIDVYENSIHIFGGTITEKEDQVNGGILISTKYTVNDWSFRLNSKLVVQTYENMDPQDIVNDIVNRFTDGTFGTTGVVLGGFDVSSIRFNYEQVTTSLEKLASQIGWEWHVDPDKEIQFFPPSAVSTAPYVIDDTTGNLEWATLNIDQSLMNMKNSIYVIGGTYNKTFTNVTTVDNYLTDGTKTVFPTAYAYTPDTIVVTLAGVSQTIGTDQVDDPGSFQVLYNEGGRFIRFTSVPTTGQTVQVYGNAQIPILARVQNDSAIATYGEIQDVIIDQQIKSIEEAQARGNSQIAKYGAPVYAVKFSTLQTGFRVGQTVSVDSNLFGEDVLVVIKKITGKPKSPTQIRYDIEAVGTERVKFVDIMKLLLIRSANQTIVTDSTILQVLLALTEMITSTDTLNTPTTSSPPYKWGPSANAGIWNKSTWG